MHHYVIGIDGGGTKTDFLLCSETGACCGRMIAGGSNHQIYGLKQTAAILQDGVSTLLAHSGVELQEVAGICMGLSGADLPEDVAALEGALAPLALRTPCQVLNDVWLPLAAMVPTGAGAVSICGTGHNTAVRKADGQRLQISALDFALGNWGGGRMLTDQAMHCAVRAYEHTGQSTLLTSRLPAMFGQPDMPELLRHLYLTNKQELYRPHVPQLLSELALEGDEISIRILRGSGRIQAEMTAGLICHAGLQNSNVPVVLAGSLYLRDQSRYMMDSYQEELKRHCPNAQVMALDSAPVSGAALLALHSAGWLNNGVKRRLLDDMKESVVSEA